MKATPTVAQIAPGPLAQAHRSLDGPLDCFKCHVAPGRKGTMDSNCLACHTEIDAMRKAKRGYHARVTDRTCASCHPDHAGRAFDLVSWGEGGMAAFEHLRAGWPLEGKHEAVECRTCHDPKFQRAAVATKIRVEHRAESWLGLDTTCVSCHRDVHRAQVGTQCDACHGVDGWKPAARFDHDDTRYPLTGQHVEVACAACHGPTESARAAATGTPSSARRASAGGMTSAHGTGLTADARYRPVPHAECSSCHRDPHAARFGSACSDCHSTDGFDRINPRGFDHDLTRYPLRGKHATLECAACHDEKRAWGRKPSFATCGACHDDAHAGQARVAGKSADCAACHSVQTFERSTFSVADHQATPYPLEGAHAEAECRLCHARGTAAEAATLGSSRVRMRPPHGACADCHRDPHGRTFASARGAADACLSCHDLHRFHPSDVDVEAHASYEFQLEGAHAAVPCQACHAELRAAAATSTLRSAHGRALPFKESRTLCASCHEDPHAGQFASRKDRGACDGCHDQQAFAPASRFDHNRDSAFKLEGAHARIACGSCHRSERTGRGLRVIWKPVPTRCESCHGGTTPDDKKSGSDPAPSRRDLALLLTTRDDYR